MPGFTTASPFISRLAAVVDPASRAIGAGWMLAPVKLNFPDVVAPDAIANGCGLYNEPEKSKELYD